LGSYQVEHHASHIMNEVALTAFID
jgi:hypothetical protein